MAQIAKIEEFMSSEGLMPQKRLKIDWYALEMYAFVMFLEFEMCSLDTFLTLHVSRYSKILI